MLFSRPGGVIRPVALVGHELSNDPLRGLSERGKQIDEVSDIGARCACEISEMVRRLSETSQKEKER